MKRIVILGTGGNCFDILDTLLAINESGRDHWLCLGFLDDAPSRQGQTFWGYPVLGTLDQAACLQDCWFINGIGSVTNFWKKTEILCGLGLPQERFATVVHPSAAVSRFARLGSGTVILQQSTVASNAELGKHVIVLPQSVISHDSRIGDYSCVTSGVCVSGNVEVGESCYLGTNSALHGHIRLGDRVLVGMGSVVRHSVPANKVVAGNPARILRDLEHE